MSDISRDSVIHFLRERGGRVSNKELLEHFRSLLTAAPPGEARAATRQLFKDIVNEVASVRPEDEVKYVCLRKKYRRAAAEECTKDAKSSKDPADEGSPIPANSPDSSSAEDASSTPEPSDEAPEEHPPDSGPGEETGDSSPESRGSPGYDAPPSISVTEEPGEDGESQAAKQPDAFHLSGRTPRNSRRGIRDPVSPQLRRGGLLLRAGVRDSDSSSLHSSSSVSGNEEEEAGAGSVALEPLEHAWMLSSCRARWDTLQELLVAEPGLITRRDFITGFSCLHWAAKHGQHELLAALLTHAGQHRVPVNINARASGGYTALHLAAMHGHLDVIKLLVGAYDADLDIRDYSGRKAWQYLGTDTARDVQALVGAVPAAADGEEDGGSTGSGRWRLSRVLPSQLIVHRMSQLPEDELDGGGRHRGDINRKGSARPRLNKIRFRTQIIHSNLSPRDPEDEIFKSPMRHRPKSNVFG